MKRRIVIFFIVTAVLLTGLTFAEVMIIANSSVPDTIVTQNDLAEIFLGKRVKWSDKSRVNVVVSKAPGLYESFLKQYLGRSPSQFENYWRRMIFTGQGKLPVSFTNDQDVIDYVADTPGAVGYVSSQSTSIDIKTISVR